jgi:hypothetical protein
VIITINIAITITTIWAAVQYQCTNTQHSLKIVAIGASSIAGPS